MGRCLCVRVRFDVDSGELICIRLRVLSVRNRRGVELVVLFVVHVPGRNFHIGVAILYYSSSSVLLWDITVRLRFVMDVCFVKWRIVVLGLTFTYDIIMTTLWFRLQLRRLFAFLTEFVKGSTKNQESKEGQNYTLKKDIKKQKYIPITFWSKTGDFFKSLWFWKSRILTYTATSAGLSSPIERSSGQ